MRKWRKLAMLLFMALQCYYINPVIGQAPAKGAYYSGATAYKTVNTAHYDSILITQRWSVELDLLLNPLYISQFGSKYQLNGHRLSASPGPRFYAVQPTQNMFSSISEILDQSNAVYVGFRMPRFEKSRWRLLHHTRLIVGITHDKLETGSEEVYYKFTDGGTELTVMLDKNITHKLSDLDFKLVNLIFSFNVQAGLFASLAKIQTHIAWEGDTIRSASNARWQFPNPHSGWGWLASANFEVGGLLCHSCSLKHFGITVGARTMVEGLYTSSDVLLNGKPGYRLKVQNYGIFMAGPVINIKYINF